MTGAPMPEIETYVLRTSGPAPKWLAVYIDKGVRLAATFSGETEAEAYGAAVDFWAREQRAVHLARVARGERA